VLRISTSIAPEILDQGQCPLAVQALRGGDRDLAQGGQAHTQMVQVALQIALLLLGAGRVGELAQPHRDLVHGRHRISMAPHKEKHPPHRH
jgi:hypothetical protein